MCLANKCFMNIFCASRIMTLVPYGGANGMDDADGQSSTDLARAWEGVDLLRRRGQLLQVVPMMQITFVYAHLFYWDVLIGYVFLNHLSFVSNCDLIHSIHVADPLENVSTPMSKPINDSWTVFKPRFSLMKSMASIERLLPTTKCW